MYMKGDKRVGVLRYRGMEDEDAHGALDAIDGRRHVSVILFDKHDVCGGLSRILWNWIVGVAVYSQLGRAGFVKLK